MKKPANTNVTGNKDTLKLDSFKVTRVKQWDDGAVSFDMVMNGYEVCENIRKTKKNLPILLLTAKGTIGDKTQGFDCGADDYLVKPFDIQEVLLRIKVLLRRNHIEETNINLF